MTSHAVEDVKQGQHFCIAGESSNVYNYSRNQFGSFLENKEYFYLKIQLYHSQAYTQEMFHHTTRNFFTIFLAALFITDRNSKQPRCPSIEKWIKKIWFIYTMEYHSAMKKGHHEICRPMDGTWKYLREWGNPDSERQSWHVLIYN